MTSVGQKYRVLIGTSTLVTHIEKSDGASAVAVLRSQDPETGGWMMQSFRLVREQENWRVEFTLQEFFGIPEEQFFDFDLVAEKRDFRHRR
ncbi:MAG: hypothetical protein HUU15_11695 [Candidatus Brocadiae bacterium]|nr:hypothetical protein [Candidatus Brocadiia bacterium]